MQIPVQITFRDFEQSAAIEANVLMKVRRLEKFCDRIISCRVVLGERIRTHQRGNLYYCRIDLKLPGKEIAVGTAPDYDEAHKNLYVAIRDSFQDAERLLKDYVRSHRVRVHLRHQEQPPHGRVLRLLYGDGGYGFLETPDGRELYFHKNSVLGGGDAFDKLEPGDEVRFAEEVGEEGPQASSVEPVGRNGRHAFEASARRA